MAGTGHSYVNFTFAEILGKSWVPPLMTVGGSAAASHEGDHD